MAPMIDTHHISQLSQCTCSTVPFITHLSLFTDALTRPTIDLVCHALGLTVLPVFMYYLSRFLRLKLLGKLSHNTSFSATRLTYTPTHQETQSPRKKSIVTRQP